MPSTGAWVNLRRFWTDLGKSGLKRPTKACRARIRIRVRARVRVGVGVRVWVTVRVRVRVRVRMRLSFRAIVRVRVRVRVPSLQDEGQVEDHGGAREAGVQLLEGLGRRSKGLARVRVRVGAGLGFGQGLGFELGLGGSVPGKRTHA